MLNQADKMRDFVFMKVELTRSCIINREHDRVSQHNWHLICISVKDTIVEEI